MCGRYTNTGKKNDELHRRMAALLGVAQRDSEVGYERFNIAPTQEVLTAVQDEEGRRMENQRWGLVPGWTEGARPRFQMINARAETVLERPAYRDLVQRGRHRCLVVADGWYEWQRPEDPSHARKPVHYSLAGGEPFCFAGLCTAGTCTILTCEANDLCRSVHHRMPVVLTDAASWQAWLDPVLDGAAVRELLAPLPSAELFVKHANPVVNSALHDGPDCLEPELTLL